MKAMIQPVLQIHVVESQPNSINPFWSYVGPRLTLWFSCSAPMLEDVRHIFVAPALLSEPVRCFSSCSTDFGQQTAQVVLFLFLGRPCVLMWTGDCALYSHGCACRKKAGIQELGSMRLAEKLDWKGLILHASNELVNLHSQKEETATFCKNNLFPRLNIILLQGFTWTQLQVNVITTVESTMGLNQEEYMQVKFLV